MLKVINTSNLNYDYIVLNNHYNSWAKLIIKFPTDIQSLILEYYNEFKEYFTLNVLGFILLKNRIKLYYGENEFIYMKLCEHHYLINVLNILNNDNEITECELNFELSVNNIKNVWIRIHITETINYFGGSNNSIIEVLYINKYNYNKFAIKIINNNNSNTYILEPIIKIYLSNYCNYYSASHFMHLPENAIKQINIW
jgi:hypothetical protein